MNLYLFTIFGLLAGFIIISIAWRKLSNHQSVPCPSSLGWLLEMDNPLAKVSHAANIIKDSRIDEGMTVLDAGCGPGRITIPLAEKVGPIGKVFALDIQGAMLSKVKKKAERKNLMNIEYLEAGLGEGKLIKESFDRAVLVMVLGEIPYREQALREIYRALKPEGVLAVTETVFDPHYLRKSVLQGIAETAGFKVQQCYGGKLAYTMVLEKIL